jgi:hypothetical protein
MNQPVINIAWLGGNCPLQAEGSINGELFYFRARGNHWRVGIGDDPVGNPVWSYEEPYGDELFAAGWMDEDEALEFIHKAARFFAEDQELDKEAERIMALPEEELDAELRREGLDPEQIAASGREMVATLLWYLPSYPRMLAVGAAA